MHGQYSQLRLILNRILPLRKSEGITDRLVLLGDYIDRRPDGPEIVDYLIEVKKEYKNQLIMLCGNHELMLLDAIEVSRSTHKYNMWMHNGGEQTLARYLERAGEPMDNPYSFPRHRIRDIIPKEHLEFYQSLESYYETDSYIFVHGGFDPSIPVNKHSKEELAWDRSLFEFMKKAVKDTSNYIDWDKTIITGHNGATGKPFIHEKFMMLDISVANKLLVVELNSMQAFVASKNKKRLVSVNLNEILTG